jgi:peptidoglycan/LPS O-acetylase OafA/YrhL
MPTAVQDNDWAIELLRGVAACMVMLVHYQTFLGLTLGLFEFLHTGVDLFFVISGFVFAPYFFGRALELKPFFVRRLARIYPLYVLSLLAYAGLHAWLGQANAYFLAHLFFLHTMVSREIAFYYNPAYWSLPAEVEFYLALPLLVAFAAWRRWAAGLLLPAALALHLVLAYISPSDPATPVDVWAILCIHLPGVLAEFMLGALAWRFMRRQPSTVTRLALLAAGLALWLALAWALSQLSARNELASNDLARGNVGLFFAAAYALLVAGAAGWARQPGRRIVQVGLWAGNLSYGVYLFHNAIPPAVNVLLPGLPAPGMGLICVILTLLTAALLHVMVENPARNWGRDLARAWSTRPLAPASHPANKNP